MLGISIYSVSVHSAHSLEYLIIKYCDWPLNLHAIVSGFLIECTNVIIFVKHSQPETKDNSLQVKFFFIIKCALVMDANAVSVQGFVYSGSNISTRL